MRDDACHDAGGLGQKARPWENHSRQRRHPQHAVGWQQSWQAGWITVHLLFYWQVADGQIWLLLAYPKSERDDLSHGEIKQQKRLVERFEA